MFTLYIHCLEVLAMNAAGQTVKTIVEMGFDLTPQRVHSALQSLMDEGYVTCDDSGPVNVWQITEKACEYCETVARKYAQSHVMDEIADYVASMEKVPSNPAVGVLPGAWEELPLQMVVSGDYVFSVDADGIPDHKYIGLASDDGSLPFDAIPGSWGVNL